MKYITAMLVACLLTGPAFAAKEVKMVEYDFPITRIIDGDTVAFEANFLPDPLKQELSIRVFGVDTPEKSWRGECDSEKALGEKASKFTKKMIANGEVIKVAIYKWDKFGGRVLGDIIIDGKSLRHALIAKGYAREYYGDKKESWCK
jgi:endonuclease YncB( thermonuclease family)|tara:strand:+ start:430 stop:870 length:441 start_codon:yes stop_codon:yes gene_type:complete